jgi:hypothetical protein
MLLPVNEPSTRLVIVDVDAEIDEDYRDKADEDGGGDNANEGLPFESPKSAALAVMSP